MDVPAETSAELHRTPNVSVIRIDASNPATSSYIAVRNESAERLRLAITMVDGGVPLENGPGSNRPSAVGNHDIAPGGQYVIAFHIPYGTGVAQNTWVTSLTISPIRSGSSVRQETFRITLVNAPGRNMSGLAGNNWATVQIVER